MWEAKKQNRDYVQPMIETLEGRELMSAVPHTAAAAKPAPAPHAVVVTAKPKATAAAKPKAAAAAKTTVIPTSAATVGGFPTYIPAYDAYLSPDVVGGWTGTMQLDGTKTTAAFSVNFLFQRGLAASGTFNLGPTVSNATVTSTMVFGANHNARILILTSTLWVGFTCALTANGKMLYGRFAVDTANGWETGGFVLNRN
jgi:hypothetical protein